MVSLCIKTNKINVINYLMNSIKDINLDNIVFVKRDFSKYTNIIVHYLGNSIPIFYSEITSVLSDCIIDNYEKQIIHNLLLLNYFYFDDDDICDIENNCIQMLTSHKSKNDKDYSSFSVFDDIENRKNYLWCAILKYILNNKSIFLDGFTTFRISNYINCIDNLVDFSVSQFVINREYSEFVNLLKIYINSKVPEVDLVHLIYINEESILLDKDKNIISLTKNNLDTHYLSDISFSSNDYALNSLLSLLPSRIIIHLISSSDDFINTIKLIFGDRVTLCTDCNICKTYKLIGNTKGS